MPLVMRMKAAKGKLNPLRKQSGDVVQLLSQIGELNALERATKESDSLVS
jgi:hypothetical protein